MTLVLAILFWFSGVASALVLAALVQSARCSEREMEQVSYVKVSDVRS